MPIGIGRAVPPQIVIEPARRKISRPSVNIRIMMMGRPARRRSATRSMPMPMHEHRHDRQRNGQPDRRARIVGECKHDIGAEHRHRALRQVGHRRGFVDQHDTDRDQRIHQADEHAVDRQIPAARSRPCVRPPAPTASRSITPTSPELVADLGLHQHRSAGYHRWRR